MSTNKTENYQLHKWEANDDFLRAEFNENFAKLDGSTRMVFGSYTGDTTLWNTPQQIVLGFRPKAVLILSEDGLRLNGNYYVYGGMAGQGLPMKKTSVVLDDAGFTVRNVSSSHHLNWNNEVYYYLALY